MCKQPNYEYLLIFCKVRAKEYIKIKEIFLEPFIIIAKNPQALSKIEVAIAKAVPPE